MAVTDGTTDKSLARRIRQNLIGRPREFFAMALPGLETLCRGELAALPDPPGEMSLDKGGVVFKARLTTCYQANLACRTSSRILMRIARFKARHFAALEAHVRAIPWELYLPPDAPLDVRVSTRQSKLYHREAVAERIRNAVRERLAASGAPSPDPDAAAEASQCLWARLQGDRITLSLDSSGAPLHRRGVKTQGGPAPLRETLAAAALMIAGYDGRGSFCDPMCGSGTFAIEAAMMLRKIPPGWYRSFAFMEWPAFREQHWAHLRKLAAPAPATPTGARIFASDRSRTAVDRLTGLLKESDLADEIAVQRRDFFDLAGAAMGGRGGLLALNPPYGRRLGQPGTAPRLVGEILRKLQQDFRGWRVILVLPEERLRRQFPFAIESHTVMHGGKPAWLAIGSVP